MGKQSVWAFVASFSLLVSACASRVTNRGVIDAIEGEREPVATVTLDVLVKCSYEMICTVHDLGGNLLAEGQFLVFSNVSDHWWFNSSDPGTFCGWDGTFIRLCDGTKLGQLIDVEPVSNIN